MAQAWQKRAAKLRDAMLGVAAAVVVELIFHEFAAEGVAMDSEGASGARLVAFLVLHHALNEAPLEFRHGFLEQNATVDQLRDERFQLILHNCILRSAAPGTMPGLPKMQER